MKKLKGFIEVQIYDTITMININKIIAFQDYHIQVKGIKGLIEIKQSYEEIKQLIKNAQ